MFAAVLAPLLSAQSGAGPNAADYTSVQEALDRNPGKRIFVAAGDHAITAALHLRASGSGLWGPGRIIQMNPDAEVIAAEGLEDIQLSDLTLTRSEGKMETHRPAVRLLRCAGVRIDNLRVEDNRGDLAAIFAAYCCNIQIVNTLVKNYSRVSIDDRTGIPGFGWAFYCIDGHGIMVRHSTGVRVENNRVVELNMLPTPETKDKFHLGKFSKKNAERGTRASQEVWDREYFNAWHQGAAIQVTKGETSDQVQLIGNYIENAAQGLDVHGDHVIIAYNIINNARSGLKVVHGSRNVILIGNQISRSDLWAILIRPGSASHHAIGVDEIKTADPEDPEGDTWPVTRAGANIDGHSVVANNIISDFGHGTSHWIWADGSEHPAPLQLLISPTPEKNPPETDLIISGNVIYDSGRDGMIVDGKVKVEPPRYKYAVAVGTGEHAPRGLHFSDNLFHGGTAGVSNVELKP